MWNSLGIGISQRQVRLLRGHPCYLFTAEGANSQSSEVFMLKTSEELTRVASGQGVF